MTRHLSHGRLLSTMLIVLLLTLGCGATDAQDDVPDRRTIAGLDPDLLTAVQAARRDARDDGVRMVVTSGWRSPAHQQRLFDEAVLGYGSEEEASRWVSTPDTSAHVTGDAVDIGPRDADHWLSQHGSDYGLCQVFANEVWHFELATTPGGTCPDMLPDSSSRG
ncbi:MULTISPECIES: M15 family metallopeptidase [unclassified Nocardioides]|uniref:M15 family metallopeptidase n=1 Tax=unclassified Nocardioides TaxID=2615069 RepID=UPI00361CA5C4